MTKDLSIDSTVKYKTKGWKYAHFKEHKVAFNCDVISSSWLPNAVHLLFHSKLSHEYFIPSVTYISTFSPSGKLGESVWQPFENIAKTDKT